MLAWCAYSAQWWEAPKRNPQNPAGIVACGEEDHRLGASLIYFKQGRAAGKPWLWVCLPRTGHAGSGLLDDFVRNYFSTILSQSPKTPTWVDIDRKTFVPASEAQVYPSLTAWLPSGELFELWALDEVHFQQHGSRCRMWVPPEMKDP
ncbi:hypothetical protein L0337_16715, partial [candidate division KSB1 bacterium]|nr:hypothetical protein [candidate division KSB1 bacterium]